MFEFVWLSLISIAASIVDFIKREIPDMLCIAGCIIGFMLNTNSTALTGLLVAYALGIILYYLKAWGGGDAKLLGVTGCVLGLTQNFAWFLLYMAAWGIIWVGWCAFWGWYAKEKGVPFAHVFALSALTLLIL